MNKFAVLLLIAVSLLVSLGLNSKTVSDKNQTALFNPIPTPKFSAEIEKIELDRNKVINSCPPGMSQREENSCNDNSLVKIKASAVNPRNVALTYDYTVSGGRIIGKGENVSWDLSGVRAGIYTVTAAVGDGSEAVTKTQTATVEVKECNCRYVDVCPVIKVSTPKDSFKAGETITFTANIAGIQTDELTYNWTVSAGTIIEGQGTPKIKVETIREMADSSLTASVEINHDRAAFCETSASETVSITK